MEVEAVFPEVEGIEDRELRTGVVRVWEEAAADAGVDDLATVPWYPPAQAELDVPDETLVDHVRDVAVVALAMAESLDERRPGSVSLDLVVAGALVHDVSKLAEFDGHERTAIGDLLGHPYYGVHLVEGADLPVELAHVVLSHTPRTNVEPATLEASVVSHADVAAADAIRLRGVEDLRDA